jgi:hypothetical protein
MVEEIHIDRLRRPLPNGAELGTHLIRARAGQRADPPASATAIAISEVADPAISA